MLEMNNGSVRIADEVIATIAGTAVQEIEGIVPGDPRNLSKGVRIAVRDCQVSVALNVSVKQGHKIADVTLAAQRRIKTALETMTGLLVESVDLHVAGLAEK